MGRLISFRTGLISSARGIGKYPMKAAVRLIWRREGMAGVSKSRGRMRAERRRSSVRILCRTAGPPYLREKLCTAERDSPAEDYFSCSRAQVPAICR